MVLPLPPARLAAARRRLPRLDRIQALLLVGILAMLLPASPRTGRALERVGLVAAFVAFPALAISFFQGAFALVLVAGVAGTVVA